MTGTCAVVNEVAGPERQDPVERGGLQRAHGSIEEQQSRRRGSIGAARALGIPAQPPDRREHAHVATAYARGIRHGLGRGSAALSFVPG